MALLPQVPSNLIPLKVTQLPLAPVASEDSLMMVVYQGNNYQIRVGDLLSVAGVPTTRQVIAGTGMTGGGQLSSNVTLSIAQKGVTTPLLEDTGVTPGVYGASTQIPVLTVDSTGRITAASYVDVAVSGYVPDSRQVIAGAGLTGGGNLATNVTLAANLSNDTPLAGDNAGSAGTATNIARGDHKHPAVDLADGNQVDNILGLMNGGTAKSLVPDAGAIIWCGADGLYVGPVGQSGQVLVSNGTGEYTWGSALIVSEQPAGYFFAGPASGPDADPLFRAIVATDIPTLNQDTTGNAGTVTNGVYTTGSYSDPSWITSLATTKLSGTVTNAQLANSSITLNGSTVSLGGSATVTAVNPYALTIGSGLSGTSYDGSAAVTITNSAPDQTVVLNNGTGISVTGTYPNFTITNTSPSTGGTVTSVGTGTGLTGGPITSTGTISFSNTAVGTWAATPSSANLAAAMTDETGSGALVFANGPTLSAPTIDGSNPYIQFNNGVVVTSAAGRMWYNGTTGSLNFGMGNGNITQQVGEEIFVYGKASAAITEGQLVMKTGVVGASGVITFAPTSAGITDDNVIIGVATENIPLNGFGRITAFGVVHGINTSAFVDGATLWYDPSSSTGGLTSTKPTAPNAKCEVGIVINAGSGGSGSIQVEIIHGTQLGGTDSNVNLVSVTGGQLLSYDQTSSYWKNINLSAGTGISVTSATNGAITVANTGVTSVTGSAPVVSSGGATPAISMAAASASANGYLTSTDWSTFNSKGSGSVTSVSGTGAVSGISLSGTVTSSGSLTLGGTLDLSSPPAIGATTPAAITGTTITATKYVGMNGGTF